MGLEYYFQTFRSRGLSAVLSPNLIILQTTVSGKGGTSLSKIFLTKSVSLVIQLDKTRSVDLGTHKIIILVAQRDLSWISCVRS